MLLAIAANVAPLAMASLLASPLEPEVVVVIEDFHDAVIQRFPADILAGVPGSYFVTVHSTYFVLPTLLVLMLLRFTRLRFTLVLNRLTLALLVLGATGLTLRLAGGLFRNVAGEAMHLSSAFWGFLDGAVYAGLAASTLALLLSTSWYRWIQPRTRWVNAMHHLLAQI